MVWTVRVRSHERGLLFRHGEFVRVLGPGTYRLWSRLLGRRKWSIEVVSTLDQRMRHPLLEVLLSHASFREQLIALDLGQTQRALVWVGGRLNAVLGPGRYAYWKTPQAVEVEVFDALSEPRFAHARIEAVVSHKDADGWIESIDVDEHHDVLLFRNGVLVERLAPGKHAFWKGAGRLRVAAVDTREKVADVAGQEIMTADKVTLRVNLLVSYQVADALKAVAEVADADQALYREAQLALRAAVGARTLDQLLADKESVGGEVRSALAGRVAEFGAAVRSVGLKDIVLPGEMKAILNQVIEAEKRAQADLIRRREETASARSQANTAKLLQDNPTLARIREMELLKETLAGTKATFVFGAGDLGQQVRSLVSGQNASGAASG